MTGARLLLTDLHQSVVDVASWLCVSLEAKVQHIDTLCSTAPRRNVALLPQHPVCQQEAGSRSLIVPGRPSASTQCYPIMHWVQRKGSSAARMH